MAKFCPNCGVALVEGMKYCPDCGSTIVERGVTSETEKPSDVWFAVPSIVCAIIALFFFSPVFGLVGILLGYFA